MNNIKNWIKNILAEGRTSSTGPGSRCFSGKEVPKIAKTILIPG